MLTINVILDEVYELKSDQTVNMVTFHGTAESEYFNGKILPGAVDTQRSVPGGMLLSARYMIDGKDNKGNLTRLFIENEGISREGEELVTTPRIITDNVNLKWIEKSKLCGKLQGTEQGVRILITMAE